MNLISNLNELLHYLKSISENENSKSVGNQIEEKLQISPQIKNVYCQEITGTEYSIKNNEIIISLIDKTYKIYLDGENSDEFNEIFKLIDNILTASFPALKESKNLSSFNFTEEKYQSLFNSSLDAILILEPGKGYIDANPSAMNLFKIKSKDELNTINPAILSPEFQPGGIKSADQAKIEIEKVIKNGAHTFEWVHRDLEGRCFDALVSASKLMIDGQECLQGNIRDISELREARKEIEISEKRLKLALKGANSGMWDWDLKSNKVFFDDNYFLMAGYEVDEFDHSYVEFRKRVHPDDIDEIEKSINNYIKGFIDSYNVEFRFKNKSGDWFWVLSQGKIVERDSSGNPSRFIGTHSNITWKKEADKSQRYFKALFEQASLSMQIFDTDGYCIAANKAWEDLWHSDFEAIKNRYNVLEDNSVKGSDWYNEFVKVFEGKKVTLPMLEYDPAKINEIGRKRTIKCVSFPIFNEGDVENIVLMHQDVTDMLETQSKLFESEQMFSKLFHSMTELVVVYELNNLGNNTTLFTVTDCNTACLKEFNTEKSLLVGKSISEVFNSDTSLNLEKLKEVVKNGSSLEFEYYDEILDKYFTVSAVSPKDNFLATISTDISAMKKIQEVVDTKNKELENYLYIASHDLRAPLVNIQGFGELIKDEAEMLKTEIGTLDIDDNQKHLIEKIVNEGIPQKIDFISTSTLKMNVLISGLLKISRTGRENFKPVKIDMDLLFAQIIKEFQYQIDSFSIDINVSKLDYCYGDFDLLNQLFSNLIGNAIKYRSNERNHKISIFSEVNYNKVKYYIEDNGIGIEPRNKERIWNVFFQVENENNQMGEGIGLNIVKRIVDKHKGKVYIESELNKGSVFIVELFQNDFD